MDNTLLARVQAAAIDGRMRNYRTRQNELMSLYQALVGDMAEFLDAIQVDEECSKAEAQIIMAATLHEVREHYNRFDFKRELDFEYSIKRGKSASRRLPAGIAYIIPDPFTLTFSVFSAVAASIEAGCCCVIELEKTLQKSSGLIRKTISQAMDNNAFVVTSSRAPADFLARCLVVDQLYQGSESDIRWNSLTSIPSSRVVAVVDRTGDLELAAKEIVASRLAFGSKSRFAVDQIMVNEFVANKFTDVVVKALAVFQARSSDKLTINGPTSRSRRAKKSEHDDARVVAEAVKRNTCSVLAAEEVATLVEVSQRSDPLLNRKIMSSMIVMHKYTSLDDVIDTTSNDSRPLGALYLFAGPGEAKYLSQYIVTRATFVNHIPSQLSVGPAFAVGHAVRTDVRYSRDMFEHPSPEIVAEKQTCTISQLALQQSTLASEAALIANSSPLKSTGQGPGGAWGYFEQGLVIGAVVYLLPVAVGSIAVAVYGGLWAYRNLVSK